LLRPLQGGEFVAEGIDQILQGRTEKRQIGGRAGNTFSVATFGVDATVVRCCGWLAVCYACMC
jgi:hypothetical protein